MKLAWKRSADFFLKFWYYWDVFLPVVLLLVGLGLLIFAHDDHAALALGGSLIGTAAAIRARVPAAPPPKNGPGTANGGA